MDHDEPRELLIRFLDGRVMPEERLRVEEILRSDGGARGFLREIAEQAVMIADVESMALARRQAVLHAPALSPEDRSPGEEVRRRPWRWVLAAAALALLAAVAFQFLPPGRPWIVRVAKATGSSQSFGSGGALESGLAAGALLVAGDTLETRSCDAWIELELRDGSRMTIGGHSTLRILDGKVDGVRFDLVRGSLWASPARRPAAADLVIRTPTVVLEARSAQFDLQTSAADTMLRVNEGTARVRRRLDGSAVEVTAGCQVATSLGRKEPLVASPQPLPVDRWACDPGRASGVILGRWLPPDGAGGARLGADPLLWPVPGRDPVLLYAAALSVSGGSGRPVLLEAGSKLLFRGRTERPQTVRFGFSTQRMRGVFAGKFEVDVGPESLGPAGGTWEVRLPLSDFRPLQPQLTSAPDGLELTDVYALTIVEDAGLEISRIELIPAETESRPADR